MTRFQAPRGTPDVLPPRSMLHQRIVRTAENLFARYGYRRIDTPVFEHTEVFVRGLSEKSDLVTKEMYTFQDKGGRSLTLRPEGTAPVVRAVLEHHLDRGGKPVKLYYTAAMFRHERPQAARYRQHTQVGVEAVGSEGPDIDAEVIHLARAVYDEVGLTRVGLFLNSIGHPGCRSVYLPELVKFLEAHRSELCKDCQRKIATNPLRTFDCKVENDRKIMAEAPLVTDYLCGSCADHFEAVQRALKELGVAFTLDPRLVRGFDYYTRTTFEFQHDKLGAQNSVGGGGRYDGLAELLGGEALPGIGFALGVDRIATALEADGRLRDWGIDVFLVTVGEVAGSRALPLASRLRTEGLSVDIDFEGRSVKAQFKSADRAGARFAVVLGERELAEDKATVRDMTTGEETTVPTDSLAEFLKSHRKVADG